MFSAQTSMGTHQTLKDLNNNGQKAEGMLGYNPPSQTMPIGLFHPTLRHLEPLHISSPH